MVAAEDEAGLVAVEVAPQPPAPRSHSVIVAWGALLLALLLAVAAGWLVDQGRQREAALAERLSTLERVPRPAPAADPEVLAAQLEQRMAPGLESIQARLLAQERQLQHQQAQLDHSNQVALTDDLLERLGQHSGQIRELRQRLTSQDAALARLPAMDRVGWRLAEARYLARLANQRLMATGDVAGATALLRAADVTLEQLDAIDTQAVHGVLRASIAALQDTPRVDVEAIYSRLRVLSDQAAELLSYALPAPRPEPSPPAGVASDWRARVDQVLGKLGAYLILRHREAPVAALLDPQTELQLRQTLQLQLRQAQLALLAGNQRLYQEALQLALGIVAEAFAPAEPLTQAMVAELKALQALAITVQPPDIAVAEQALERAVTAWQPNLAAE